MFVSVSEESIGRTSETSGPVREQVRSGGVDTAVAGLSGLFMLAAGVWALVSPRSFADVVGFAYSEHFLHDAGAFQIGIGVALLLALVWRDALATALAALLGPRPCTPSITRSSWTSVVAAWTRGCSGPSRCWWRSRCGDGCAGSGTCSDT